MRRPADPPPSPADEAPFLAAIRESPDEDAPRLVFADWLEERGDQRAELVRVQCQLARLELEDERRPPLAERERELLMRNGRRWMAALPKVDGLEWGIPASELDIINAALPGKDRSLTFHRGLPTFAQINRQGLNHPELYEQTLARQFLWTEDEALLALGDTATAHFWDRCEGLFGRAVQLPLIERQRYPRMERLSVHAPSVASMEALSRAEIPRLRWLRVLPPFPQPGQTVPWSFVHDGLEHLARWQALTQLRSLHVSASGYAAAGELLSSPLLNQLRELCLTGQIIEEEFRMVFERPQFARLVRLALALPPDLRGCDFAASENAQRLEYLELFRFGGHQGLQPFQERLLQANLPRLRTLNLESMFLGRAAGMLARASLLRPLHVLRLSACDLGDAGCEALASNWPPDLRELYLADNGIGEAGAFALAAQPALEQLDVLDLSDNWAITSAARHALWKRCGKAVRL